MKRMRVFPLLGVLVAVGLLAGCGSPPGNSEAAASTKASSDSGQAENTDPRKGWVTVIAYDERPEWEIAVLKTCDAGNLLYVTPGYRSGAHSITVIENSPECDE